MKNSHIAIGAVVCGLVLTLFNLAVQSAFEKKEPEHFGKWSDSYLQEGSGCIVGYTYLQKRIDTNSGLAEIRVVLKTP